MSTCEFTFRILGNGSSRSELKSPKNSSEKKFHLTRIQAEILNENKSSSSINRLSILILLSYTFFPFKAGVLGRSRPAFFRKNGQLSPELLQNIKQAISLSGGTYSPWFSYMLKSSSFSTTWMEAQWPGPQFCKGFYQILLSRYKFC